MREAAAGVAEFRAWLFDGIAKIPRPTMQNRPVIRAEYREKWLFGLRTLPTPPADFNRERNLTPIPLV
jgi:hypothetical protein